MGIVWLKTYGKYANSNEMVELVCQSILVASILFCLLF
jgi:hypothetical protein